VGGGLVCPDNRFENGKGATALSGNNQKKAAELWIRNRPEKELQGIDNPQKKIMHKRVIIGRFNHPPSMKYLPFDFAVFGMIGIQPRL